MSTKHTPGPWAVEENCMAGGITHLAITNRANSDWFVCSITPMKLKKSVDKGNAALIAAAPDLLGACKVLLDAEGAMVGTEYGNQLLGEAISKARAAIALADARPWKPKAVGE